MAKARRGAVRYVPTGVSGFDDAAGGEASARAKAALAEQNVREAGLLGLKAQRSSDLDQVSAQDAALRERRGAPAKAARNGRA